VIDWTVIDAPMPRAASAIKRRSPAILRRPHVDQRRHRISPPSARSLAVQGSRHIIDVSGDGTNNAGRDGRAARDDVRRQGIIINGPGDPDFLMLSFMSVSC